MNASDATLNNTAAAVFTLTGSHQWGRGLTKVGISTGTIAIAGTTDTQTGLITVNSGTLTVNAVGNVARAAPAYP